MRVYTLALSVIAHLLAVTFIVAIPLYATDALPDPRRAIEFVQVMPVFPTPPPPLRPVREQRPAASASTAAPVEEPRGVNPEPDPPPLESFDAPRSVIDGAPFLSVALAADPVPPPPPRQREPIRVGGTITRPERVRDTPPVYPAIARAANVEGTVVLEAVISVDGAVQDVRVLRSIPLLDRAAVDAVRQWLFTPTRLNGEPVPVVMTVTVTFRLR